MAGDKEQRVARELHDAGFTGLRASRMEAKGLYKLLHDDEHVEGAIRGRLNGDGAMFVATNKRMLLLNYKPLFRNNEEISYFVLAGVSYNPQGSFAGVTIHTRMGDFLFKYVNIANAKKFVEVLERKHLELQNGPKKAGDTMSELIPKQAHMFLASHNIGVLSSIDKNGGANGAAVYYVIAPDNTVYMVTKEGTNKAQNIRSRSTVAFTVYDETIRATAQIQGKATVERDNEKAQDILHKIIKPHLYNAELAWPPITQIAAGQYQVIAINPTDVKFTQFN